MTMGAFGVTLVAAVAVFAWQAAKLHELRSAPGADRGARAAVVATADAPVDAMGDRQGGRVAVRKATLMERVNAKLLESAKPEEVAVFLHSRDEQVRARIVAKLRTDEKEAFKKAFAAYDLEWVQAAMNASLPGKERAAVLADISAREKSWVEGQLGPERAAALAEEDAGFQRTRMAQQVVNAVTRVDEVVNLSAEQRTRLQEAFAVRAQQPPEQSPQEGLMIRPYGYVTVDRTTPDLQEEAEKVLTPEQWAAYTEIRTANAEADGEKMNWMMTKIMPSFLNALQAAADGE